MDQAAFLSRTLWQYFETSTYTDLSLICKDGELDVHTPMLASILINLGVSCSVNQERPECLVIPDLRYQPHCPYCSAVICGCLLTTFVHRLAEVVEALKVLYLKNDPSSLENLLRTTGVSVKSELVDAIEDHEFKVDIKDVLDEHAFNNIEDEIAVNESESNGSDHSEDQEEDEDWKPERKALKKSNNVFKSEDEESTLGFKAKKSETAESLQCNMCEIKFKQGGAYKRHKLTVHNEKEEDVNTEWEKLQQDFQWSCRNCGRKFLNRHNLHLHIRKEHPQEESPNKKRKNKPPVKDSKCPYCPNKKLYSQYYLKVHIFNAHKDKRDLHSDLEARFSCDKCDDEHFWDKTSLTYHQETQHSVSATCKLCSKVLSNSIIMKQHMKLMHSDSNRSVVCEHCSKEFKTKTFLKRHIERLHSNTSPWKFPCALCSMGRCNSEEALQKHMLECHSGLKYQCEKCDKSFTSPHARSQHERNQHEEKTLQCDQCDMRFVLGSKLRAHIKKTHQKIKNQICPHCGEAFEAYSVAFKAHVNRHTENRQFGCETCGKSFLVEGHLKSHKKLHTLPYFCDKCDSRFGSTLALKEHTRIVHDQQEILCRHGCGYSSWTTAGRNRHEKSYCKLNPLPNAPYTISAGTANSLTMQVNLKKLSCTFLLQMYSQKLKAGTE